MIYENMDGQSHTKSDENKISKKMVSYLKVLYALMRNASQ